MKGKHEIKDYNFSTFSKVYCIITTLNASHLNLFSNKNITINNLLSYETCTNFIQHCNINWSILKRSRPSVFLIKRDTEDHCPVTFYQHGTRNYDITHYAYAMQHTGSILIHVNYTFQ